MSEDMRKYTQEQTARMREEAVARLAGPVGQTFEKYPELRSALMLVAQYWADEADDAVHHHFIFSKLATPDLEAVEKMWREDTLEDPTNLPEDLEHITLSFSIRDDQWDSNGDAIPVFAAFTKEGCDQEMSMVESGAPYAMFRRSPTGVEVELVGEMRRPWLDGVRPEWTGPSPRFR